MFDEHKPGAPAATLLIALLMAAGASAAGGDPALVAAARNQDAPQVRALLKQRAQRERSGGRRLDGAVVGRALERPRGGRIADPRRRRCQRSRTIFARRRCLKPAPTAAPSSSACCSKAGANPNTPIATGETPIMTCAAQRQRERRPDAGGARRRRQRERAVAEPDRADVGGRRAPPGRGTRARRSRVRTCRPTRERASPRCTSRRARAIWRARGRCSPRA